MHRLGRACVVTLVLGLSQACVTEPVLPALTGQFGGRLLSVTATDTAAHFQFACWAARTGPLRPDDDGIAEARGWAGAHGAGINAADFRVIVLQRADTLRVFSTFVSNSYVWTDSNTVRRGVPADFSGVGCLDAT